MIFHDHSFFTWDETCKEGIVERSDFGHHQMTCNVATKSEIFVSGFFVRRDREISKEFRYSCSENGAVKFASADGTTITVIND
jgi:hypothetical protein